MDINTSSPHDNSHQPRSAGAMLNHLLGEFEANWSGEGPPFITLGELFARMHERAFGLLLLLLALPCCLPFVYGLPQIVALPMLLLAGQMALGHQTPWLPSAIRSRKLAIGAAQNVVRRAAPYLRIAEWFAHPRLSKLTGPVGTRIVGAILLVPTASILVPLPLTNTVPGIAVAIVSVGLVERDGLFVAAGLVLGILWVLALIIGGHAAISALFNLFAA